MGAIATFAELLDDARDGEPVAVALVGADNPSAREALDRAADAGIARPVLVGESPPLEAEAAARAAVELARDGEVGVLLKGSLRTDQLMRAALDRDTGLRTERLLSDVLLYEDTLSGRTRLVAVTDGGINPAPDAYALRQIVANAVDVLLRLGWERPRVAVLSATEAVTDAVPSTLAARDVADWAAEHLPDADVAGPLALDNALLTSAAQAKGIAGPVAGRADILVTPSIEAGNILGKGVKYLAGSLTAHVVMGARVPILIPSRVESAEDKLHSIALGVLMARGQESTIP